MKHPTTGLLTGLALCLLAPAAALAESTQEGNPGYTFSRTPSRGKPGTVIHIEGTGCSYDGKPYEHARVSLYFREKDGSVTAEAAEDYEISDDGSFSGELTVPDNARPGQDLLVANCYASDMVFPVADSDFTVDRPSPTPTPTPSRTTPTPTPIPTPVTDPDPPRPEPSATRTATPRPTPSRTAARALPSPTLPVTTPSPSAVANSRPTDTARNPSAWLVMAAVALIGANGLGIRTVLRPPSRR